MARKRASMREGPLAELFRATESAQQQPPQQPEPEQTGRAGKRSAARARLRAASISRSFGAAEVTSSSSSLSEAAATSSTARANGSSFACEGFVKPLILRTYCSAASRTSSSVADGSKLNRVWMFRHMPPS